MIIFAIVMFLLAAKSCKDEAYSDKIKHHLSRVKTAQNEQKDFIRSCQLLSSKYSVDENIVKQILLGYYENFEPCEYLIFTKNELPLTEEENKQCIEEAKKTHLTMKELIKGLAVQNQVQESLVANIISDSGLRN